MISKIAVISRIDRIINPIPATISRTPVKYTQNIRAGIKSGIIIAIPFLKFKMRETCKYDKTAIPGFLKI